MTCNRPEYLARAPTGEEGGMRLVSRSTAISEPEMRDSSGGLTVLVRLITGDLGRVMSPLGCFAVGVLG
eukprot:6613217-Pyramimonas_sp.AAC.1